MALPGDDPNVTFKFFQLTRQNGITIFVSEDSNGNFYHGRSHESIEALQKLSPPQIKDWVYHMPTIMNIPYNTIWRTHFPAFHPETMTKYTGSVNDPDVFVKYQNALQLQLHTRDGDRFAELLRREIAVGEALLKSPHPNLAEYKGVVVHEYLGVVAIVYKRYTCDMWDFLLEDLLRCGPQVEALMNGLRHAVDHFNSLGFGHNDIRPANVFLTIKGKASLSEAKNDPPDTRHEIEVVLGDFDAAVPLGKPIDMKWAPQEWWPRGMPRIASMALDRRLLGRTMVWMRETWTRNIKKSNARKKKENEEA
ncbi:hypothetical protein P280DRAFT_484818 [Massarina eburnea CBS 473.64]|uniref:Protein kinase domain-containing protein n=1 Tax=Massarina eburnea CBS 473.64 TaxID=1395130 RepID=A0A6A6RI96_9PLEO|nr:hypothetical protein P280DRAFT_484818 [Massarina eburnea CBS 473.64]